LISRIQLINPIYFKRKHHNKDEWLIGIKYEALFIKVSL
jgi:hypothetical protein